MLSLELSKDLGNRSKSAENKEKSEEKGLRIALLNDESLYLQGAVQDEQGRESGDKGKGCGRGGYGEQELLTSCCPPQPSTHIHTRAYTHTIKDRDRGNVFE